LREISPGPISTPAKLLRQTLTVAKDHFPLTLQGVITLVLTLLCLRFFAYGDMDLVVFALTICTLAIVGFCLLFVFFGGLILKHRIKQQLNLESTAANSQARSAYKKVEAGFPNETGFTLPALALLPLVKLSWEIVHPDYIKTRTSHSGDDKWLAEEIIPSKRCFSDSITRRFTVADVLGFCQFSWRLKQEAQLVALPRTNSVKPLPLLRSLTAEDGIPNPSGDPDGDRMEIRPYVPGDSVRNIMWKVFARNRQLNVRLAEKSVFHSNRTVAYLLTSPNDEAAAAVARIALESGALGDDWAFGADGSEAPCVNLESSLIAIAKSRAIGNTFSYGLDNFLSQAVDQRGAHCIVFAAAEMAPWLPPLKQTVARYQGRFSVVLATDGIIDPEKLNFWQRILFQDDKSVSAQDKRGSTSRAELAGLLTDIGQLVESTLVVDRNTGFSFDHNLKKV